MKLTGPPNFQYKTFLEIRKKKANISSKDLAVLLQVTPQTFAKVTTRLDRLGLTDLITLATALQETPMDFIYEVLLLSEILTTKTTENAEKA